MSESEKKDTGHYAWASDIQKRREELAALGAVNAPRPVSVAQGAGATLSSPPAAGSAWNAAGTWEDKNVSSKGQQTLKDKLKSSVKVLEGGLAFTVPRVTKAEGEVNQVTSRGQRRLGYDLIVSMDWEVVDGSGAAVASGTVTLDEVSDMDSDIIGSLSSTCKSCQGSSSSPGWSTPSECNGSIKKSVTGHLRDVIKEWVEDMKRV